MTRNLFCRATSQKVMAKQTHPGFYEVNTVKTKPTIAKSIILTTISTIVLTTILVTVLCLSGCGDRPQTPSDQDTAGYDQLFAEPSIATAMLEVLQARADFFSTEVEKSLNLSQLKQSVTSDDTVTVEVGGFTVADLDGDSVPEVVLGLKVNEQDNMAFEVLRYQDGTVYGYTLWYRAFMDVKTDGTFCCSGGSADTGIGRIGFNGLDYIMEKISYSMSAWDTNNNQTVSFFVRGENSDETGFLTAMEEQSQKPGVSWLEFSAENVERALSRS